MYLFFYVFYFFYFTLRWILWLSLHFVCVSVGEVDGAAGDTDSHRADDSVAEAGNDSLAQGDITVDSVKVHMR